MKIGIGNQDFLLLINLIRDLHSQLETLFIHTHTLGNSMNIVIKKKIWNSSKQHQTSNLYVGEVPSRFSKERAINKLFSSVRFQFIYLGYFYYSSVFLFILGAILKRATNYSTSRELHCRWTTQIQTDD